MVFGVSFDPYDWVRKLSQSFIRFDGETLRLNTEKVNRILQGQPENPFQEFEEKLQRRQQPSSPRQDANEPKDDACRAASSRGAHNTACHTRVSRDALRCPFEVLSASATVPGILRVSLTLLSGGCVSVSSVHVVLRLLRGPPQDETCAEEMTAKAATSAPHAPLPRTTSAAEATSASSSSYSSDAGVGALLERLLMPIADRIAQVRRTAATEVDIEWLTVQLLAPDVPSTARTSASFASDPCHHNREGDDAALQLECRHVRFRLHGTPSGTAQLDGTISLDSLHCSWHAPREEASSASQTGVPTAKNRGPIQTSLTSGATLLRCGGAQTGAEEKGARTSTACTATFSYGTATTHDEPAASARREVRLTGQMAPLEVIVSASDIVALHHLVACTVAPSSTPGTAPTTPSLQPTPPHGLDLSVLAHAAGVSLTVLLSPVTYDTADTVRPTSFWGPLRDSETRASIAAALSQTEPWRCEDAFSVPHITFAAEALTLARPSATSGHDLDGLLSFHGEKRVRSCWARFLPHAGSSRLTAALKKSSAATGASRALYFSIGSLHCWQRNGTTRTEALPSSSSANVSSMPPLIRATRGPCAVLIAHRSAPVVQQGNDVMCSEVLVGVSAVMQIHVELDMLTTFGAYVQSLLPCLTAASSTPGPMTHSQPAKSFRSDECVTSVGGGTHRITRVTCRVHGLEITIAHEKGDEADTMAMRVELSDVQLQNGPSLDNLSEMEMAVSRSGDATSTRVQWQDLRVLFRPNVPPIPMTFSPVSVPHRPAEDEKVPGKAPLWALLLQCEGGPGVVACITARHRVRPHATHEAPCTALSVEVCMHRICTGSLTMAVCHTLAIWTAHTITCVESFRRCMKRRQTGMAARPAHTSASQCATPAPSANWLRRAILKASDATRTVVRVRASCIELELLAPRLTGEGMALGAPLIYGIVPSTAHEHAKGACANGENNTCGSSEDLSRLFHRYVCVCRNIHYYHHACATKTRTTTTTTNAYALENGVASDVHLQIADLSIHENIPTRASGAQGMLVGRVCLVERVQGEASTSTTRQCSAQNASNLADLRISTTHAVLSRTSDKMRSTKTVTTPDSPLQTCLVAYEKINAQLQRLCVHHLPSYYGDTWIAALSHFLTPPALFRDWAMHKANTAQEDASCVRGQEKKKKERTKQLIVRSINRRVDVAVRDVVWCAASYSDADDGAEPGDANVSTHAKVTAAPMLVVLAPALTVVATVCGAEGLESALDRTASTRQLHIEVNLPHPAYAYVSPTPLTWQAVQRQLSASSSSLLLSSHPDTSGSASVWCPALESIGLRRLVELAGTPPRKSQSTTRTSERGQRRHIDVLCVSPLPAQVRVRHLHLAVFITPQLFPALASIGSHFSVDGDAGRLERPAALVAEGGGTRFEWVPRQAERLAAPVTVAVHAALAQASFPLGSQTQPHQQAGARGECGHRVATEGMPMHGDDTVSQLAALHGYESHVLPLLTGPSWRTRVRTAPSSARDNDDDGGNTTRPTVCSTDTVMGHTDFQSLPTTPRGQDGAVPDETAMRSMTLSLESANLMDIEGGSGTAWHTVAKPLLPLDEACQRRPQYLSLLSQTFNEAEKIPPARHRRLMFPHTSMTYEESDSNTEADACDAESGVHAKITVKRCPVHVVVSLDVPGAVSPPNEALTGRNSTPSPGRSPAPSLTSILTALRKRCTQGVSRCNVPIASERDVLALSSFSCLLLEVAELEASLTLFHDSGAAHQVQKALRLVTPRVCLYDFAAGLRSARAGGLLLSHTPAQAATASIRPAPFLSLRWLTARRLHTSRVRTETGASVTSEESIQTRLHPFTVRLTESALLFYESFLTRMGTESSAGVVTSCASCLDSDSPCAAPPPLYFRSFILVPTTLTIASNEVCDRFLMERLVRYAWQPAAKAASLPLGLLLRFDGVTFRIPYLSLHNADTTLLGRKLSEALVLSFTEQSRSLAEQMVRPVRSISQISSAALDVVTQACDPRASFPARLHNATRASVRLWHSGRAQLGAGVSFASGNASQWARACAEVLVGLDEATDASAQNHIATSRDLSVPEPVGGVFSTHLEQSRLVLRGSQHNLLVRVPAATLLLWAGALEAAANSLDASRSEQNR